MKGQFIPKSDPKVWESSKQEAIELFGIEVVEEIKSHAVSYVENLNFDAKKEHERIRLYQLDKSRKYSHYWQYWGANHSVKTSIDFDYSSTLEAQRIGARDKQRKITDYEESAFAGALMCCDTPARTIGFLVSVASKELKLSLGQHLELQAEVSKYVWYQMVIAFVIKHELDFGRPADYDSLQGNKKTVSIIPNPNHGSKTSGHSTVGKGSAKIIKTKYPQISDEFIQLCEEVGLARIVCGIHWFTDHEMAQVNVDKYHKLILNKL